ncbi:MAG: hypothetical protein IJP64_05390 [Oscillospiraceae bacterium]|nr:hypothetical protein [Oscillospiraceae bacterium]
MKTVFYRAEHIAALRRKYKRWTVVFALVCALTLGLVVYCAAARTTLNASRMEWLATAALTGGGWLAIAIRDCALRHFRTSWEHEERILASEEPARDVRGHVTTDKKHVSIPRSIEVRGVRVQTAEGPVRLLINASFAKELERLAAQGELSLHAVEGYVTEVER